MKVLSVCCAIAPIVAGIAGCSSDPPAALDGVWGSQDAVLELDTDGGRIGFRCADGVLDSPVIPGGNGAFQVSGTLVSGPIWISEDPVEYLGSVRGDLMTLRIVIVETGDTFRDLELVEGFEPRLPHCQ